MHTMRLVSPQGNLSEFVRAYAYRIVDLDAKTECIPARLEQTLEFQLGSSPDVHFPDGRSHAVADITVVGGYTGKPVTLVLRGHVKSFAIFFRPNGFSRLFGIPPHTLANRAYDGSSLLGRKVVDLRSKLAGCSSFQELVATTDVFLRQCAEAIKCSTTMMSIADYVFDAHGAIRVSEAAGHAGLGTRQFERKFLREIGVTPKYFARVARFQTALDLKIHSPHRSWLEIAHRLQYHDQMHMVHEFRSFLGESPNGILPQLGDARPPALCTPDSREERVLHYAPG